MPNDLKRAFDLIAVDCDGTLLDSQKNLSAEVRQAAHEAHKAGLDFTLISGRNIATMRYFVDELPISAPIVGGGGAFLYDIRTEKLLEESTLPLPEVRELVKICREMDIILTLEYIDYALQEKTNPYLVHMNQERGYQRRVVPDLLQELTEAPFKAMLLGKDETLSAALEAIRQRGLFDSMSFSSPISADIVPQGVNKGSGLRHLADYVHVPLERIAVIGDWMNDLDMFRISGLSVAMGNAPAEVQAAADLVAPSNDQDGAAWAIRKVLQRE